LDAASISFFQMDAILHPFGASNYFLFFANHPYWHFKTHSFFLNVEIYCVITTALWSRDGIVDKAIATIKSPQK